MKRLWAAGWNPPSCIKNSIAPVQLGSTSRISSGWTHTVLTTEHGLAYVADASKLKAHYGSCDRTPVHAGPQHQQQQEDKYNGQLAEHSNSVWQLITFHPSIPTAPEAPIQSTVSVLQVAAGDLHCLLLDSHGGVWTLGSNNNGQLGTAGTQGLPAATPATAAVAESIEQPTQPAVASQQQQQQGLKVQPVMVMGPGSAATCQEPVAQVAAGACHSLAVTANTGRLYCWGWSAHGQCATGTTSDVPHPTLCTALDGVPLAAAAAGMAHTVTLSKDGAVYACGWNNNGQLGLGSGRGTGVQGGQQQQQQSSLLPVLVESPVMDDEHIIQVACGTRHSVALAASGKVFTWGFNKYGQCCTTVPQIAAAAMDPAAEGLQWTGNQASSSAGHHLLQSLADVHSPHPVVLPQMVSLAAQDVIQLQPSGDPATGDVQSRNHSDYAAEGNAHKHLQLGTAVRIQAGGWHTLIEVQVKQQ